MSASVTRFVRFPPLPFVTLLAAASACSGASPAEKAPQHAARGAASTTQLEPSTPAPSASAASPPVVEEIVQGRTILGSTAPTNLPTSIEPLPADRAALLVTHGADARESFVRWIGDGGQVGPVLRLVDEYVVTAYARADGKRDFVTGNGQQLCITRHAPNLTESEARVCAPISAKAVAVLDRKLAVISLEENTIKVERTSTNAPVRKAKPIESAKPAAKTNSKKKPAPAKKKTPAKKKNATSKPKVEKKVEIIRREFEVLASFASSDGFGEAKRIGLKFVPPLDGMTIVDAASSSRGMLLSWFEKSKQPPGAPKSNPKLPPALGWASIHAGYLDATGTFDASSNKVVVESEYDWGHLRGFAAPRFVDTNNGFALLTQKTPRGGPCDMSKVGEMATFAVPNSVCSIDPTVALGADVKALESILAEGPKRRPGQPKSDPELVAWVGNTGYFVTNEGRSLRSAKRDGTVRDEPPPFLARRSRMNEAELYPDGSGWALVDGKKYRVDAAGEMRTEPAPEKNTMPSARGFDGQWNEVLALVRPGYRTIPRASGGVIVVGISTAKDENVLAVTIGTRGQLGVAASTSLKVAPGEFDLHVEIGRAHV